MSCKDCEKAQQETDKVAYFRWGSADIVLLGCKKHLLEITVTLNAHQEIPGCIPSDRPRKATDKPQKFKEFAESAEKCETCGDRKVVRTPQMGGGEMECPTCQPPKAEVVSLDDTVSVDANAAKQFPDIRKPKSERREGNSRLVAKDGKIVVEKKKFYCHKCGTEMIYGGDVYYDCPKCDLKPKEEFKPKPEAKKANPWICELCYKSHPGDQGLPSDWQRAFQSNICPACSTRATREPCSIVKARGGCYATIEDPRLYEPFTDKPKPDAEKLCGVCTALVEEGDGNDIRGMCMDCAGLYIDRLEDEINLLEKKITNHELNWRELIALEQQMRSNITRLETTIAEQAESLAFYKKTAQELREALDKEEIKNSQLKLAQNEYRLRITDLHELQEVRAEMLDRSKATNDRMRKALEEIKGTCRTDKGGPRAADIATEALKDSNETNTTEPKKCCAPRDGVLNWEIPGLKEVCYEVEVMWCYA